MSTYSKDDLLISLRVIGSIKANDRLYTRTSPMRVESWNYMQGINRTLYGEGRLSNITSIQKCFSDAFAYVESGLMMEENYRLMFEAKIDSVPPNVFRDRLENLQFLENLRDALMVSIKGLAGLRITYAGDARVMASLDIVEQNIKNKLEQLRVSQSCRGSQLVPSLASP